MFAIIKTGGKQYKIKENDIIFVAHSNSTSNLYKINIDTPQEKEQLTFFVLDLIN